MTGGIGSGKSAFCAVLRQKGFAVYSCDEISAQLWRDREYLSALAKLFPGCTVGGLPDKRAVAETVFSNEEALKKLNAFSHPRIMERLLAYMRNNMIAFAEVPLLFEGGYESLFEGVIAVRRNAEERIASVMERDGLPREQVSARMDRQFDAALLSDKNCFIVENNGDLAELERRAEEALRYFHILQ